MEMAHKKCDKWLIRINFLSDTKSTALLVEDDDDLFASVPSTKTKKKKETKKLEVSIVIFES